MSDPADDGGTGRGGRVPIGGGDSGGAEDLGRLRADVEDESGGTVAGGEYEGVVCCGQWTGAWGGEQWDGEDVVKRD